MDNADRRRILSLAFEPYEDSYLYYRNRWSGGVQVSAEERERFISSNAAEAFSLGRQFAQRPAVTPPRYYDLWLVVDAMPLTVAGGLAIVAMAAVDLTNRADPVIPPAVSWGRPMDHCRLD